MNAATLTARIQDLYHQSGCSVEEVATILMISVDDVRFVLFPDQEVKEPERPAPADPAPAPVQAIETPPLPKVTVKAPRISSKPSPVSEPPCGDKAGTQVGIELHKEAGQGKFQQWCVRCRNFRRVELDSGAPQSTPKPKTRSATVKTASPVTTHVVEYVVVDGYELRPVDDVEAAAAAVHGDQVLTRTVSRTVTAWIVPDSFRHGTHTGFAAHQSAGETPCPPCSYGERLYQRDRKRDQRAAVAR